MNKRIAALVGTSLAALIVVTGAFAQPNSATTELLTTPVAGQTLYVTFTVYGATPVVPYEYAYENTCTLKSGHFTLGQHDAIVSWTDQGPGGTPQVTVPIYLQSVPTGASCRVSLVDKNTLVKGSTKNYIVG